MSSPRAPTLLRIVLAETLRALDLERPLKAASLEDLWPEVVGPEVAQRTRAGALSRGRLTVLVTDSVWLQQLTMLKPRLIEALNRHLGEPLVQDLFFRVETLPRAPILPAAPPPLPVEPPPQVILDAYLAPVQGLPCESVLARILRRALAR
ncbi:MAG: DUF721 domain-containing protein [candidate division NC10 bacterium]|nr:DUF721 domain-containing protein [candidate division NC10 bacterium]